MSPHTFILICIIQSWNSVSCTFNIWLLIIKMSKEWVYIIVKMKMFAQKSTSLNYKKNNWHINAVEIASTMPLRYSIFFFIYYSIYTFKFFTKLFFSKRENIVRWLWQRTLHSLNSIFYVEFQATTFFFKYNRNYKIESHLLSYDSTCEKTINNNIQLWRFKKNMIWWVVFSLRYIRSIVEFGSRKIFGDNKFLISIVFKKWSNRNNLNTTRWLKSVF